MPKKLVPAIFFILATVFITPSAFAGTTPPVTSHTLNPATPDGNLGWYKSIVTVTLNATDLESGVAEINYRLNNGLWQKVEFSNTLNLAPNPSFENAGATSTGIENWEASVEDAFGSYSRDPTTSYTGFEVASAKIQASEGVWHGINNKTSFAVSNPFDNMTASIWLKTQGVTESTYFTVYSIGVDQYGTEVVQLLGTSSTLTGTNDWTPLSLDFTVTSTVAYGVYIDFGLSGGGTVWADAVSINSSTKNVETSFTVGSDNESHTIEYYSVDNAGNSEAYLCPSTNCFTLKIDMTPPGNWHNSGAFRGFFGSPQQLWVYTVVEDDTSGLSVFTDKYQYHTELEPGFGRYSNIFTCSSTWLPDTWLFLISPPFTPGANSAFLLTPKTDFCNTNWRICKIVRFFSEDMAGNEATKDFCINGPWIKIRGVGTVRSNYNIDMLSEAENDNTDGLIEAGGTNIDFFTSSRGFRVLESPTPPDYDYNKFSGMIESKSEITGGNLVASTGVYYVNGNYDISTATIPSNYNSAKFNQIVFVDGDLLISDDIQIHNESTALYIVSGKVEINKTVENVGIGLMADGDFYTAYNIQEGDDTNTIFFRGIYSANKFVFQRTLQGTDNNNLPSEDFAYEAKYLVGIKDFFGKYSVTWKNIE